jgi:hypothetical protein
MRRLLDSLLFSGETKSLLEFCWACNLAHVSALQWYPKPVSPVLCSCLWKKFHGVCDCMFDSMHSISTMMVVSRTWFSENLCRDDLLYTSIFYHLEYMIFWKFMSRQCSLYLWIVFYHFETLRSLHVHEKEIVAMTTRITMWFVSISCSLWKAWNI